MLSAADENSNVKLPWSVTSSTKALYILYEHASGYALLQVKEFEEIGALIPQIEATVLNPSLFLNAVKLIAFSPFKSGMNALENMNAISEGVLNEELRVFLESNLPSKRKKVCLGLSSKGLAQTINEELGISVKTTDAVPEIIRGIRQHFHLMVKGLTPNAEDKAQLGLGHAYSRAKIKFNVNRSDNMIIQAIALLDQLDKDINTFAMRIREWYGYHFPELYQIVPDNFLYAKCVQYIGNRKEMPKDAAEKLEEIIMDSKKAESIIAASKSSIGMDITDFDLVNIEMFCERVIDLFNYRSELHEYLKLKMNIVAPNLYTIIGEQVGARLISHAGSLTNLAKYPASTIQILGAEKALFRALKTRSATPKYGLLFHASLIGKAGKENKGRISRNLANKCAIASRIDCFSDVPTNIFGSMLKTLVENRLKYYESGDEKDRPPLTSDVMSEACNLAEIERIKLSKKAKKKLKKLQKLKKESMDENTLKECETTPNAINSLPAVMETENTSVEAPVKTDDSSNNLLSKRAIATDVDSSVDVPRKKKKKKSKIESVQTLQN